MSLDTRQEQVALAKTLQVSELCVARDECDTYALHGTWGNIYSTGSDLYMYVKPNSTKGWNNAKRTLKFLKLINDGDDEGRFLLEGRGENLSPAQKQAIRKVLNLRKKRILTDTEKATLRQRLERSKTPLGTPVP